MPHSLPFLTSLTSSLKRLNEFSSPSKITISSSFQSDAKPERTKLLWVIPWKRKSTAVGYSQALNMTWEDYKEETGNTRANRKNFKDSADFIGWYASKGYYQGFDRLDARSLYLAYHEGYGGFKKKSYRVN